MIMDKVLREILRKNPYFDEVNKNGQKYRFELQDIKSK